MENTTVAWPSGPDVNEAPKLLGITGSLYIVALFVFSARIHTRFWQRQLGWDDFTITFAMAFAIVEWSLIATAAQYGFGRHDDYVPAENRVTAQHLLFASGALWAACILFIRISIACMLLRFKHTRSWRIFLRVMIAVQMLSCVASLLFQVIRCDPIAHIWDPTAHPKAACVRRIATQVNMYVHSGIGTATDLMLALIPLPFLWRASCPFQDKIALSILIALGLFATASSIAKTIITSATLNMHGTLYAATDVILWSLLEQQTGIIASCVPCLRPFFDRAIKRFSVSSPEHHQDLKTRRNHPDVHLLAPLRLPITNPPLPPDVSLNLILPNPSSTTANSMLGRSSTDPSGGTTWPAASGQANADERERDDAYQQMLTDGGILLTTEFRIRSEVMSRVGSQDGDEGGTERETQKEIEERRVERPSTESWTRGWDII